MARAESLPVIGWFLPAVNGEDETCPFCQGLPLSGEVAAPLGADGEGHSQYEPSQAHSVRQLFPFLSPVGDIFPRPGEVFPLGESLWQGREVSALYRSAGEGDTFRFRQSLHLRGRWHGVSRDGEGCSQYEPSQAHSVRQLFPFLSPVGDIFPRPGEVFPLGESLWQGREVSALYRSAGEGDTFRFRQSLALRERWHGVSRDGEGHSQPSQAHSVRQLSRGESPWQGRKVCRL